jgi:hypothetical protein
MNVGDRFPDEGKGRDQAHATPRRGQRSWGVVPRLFAKAMIIAGVLIAGHLAEEVARGGRREAEPPSVTPPTRTGRARSSARWLGGVVTTVVAGVLANIVFAALNIRF